MRLDRVFVPLALENSWPARALDDASVARGRNAALMRALADRPQRFLPAGPGTAPGSQSKPACTAARPASPVPGNPIPRFLMLDDGMLVRGGCDDCSEPGC